MAGIGVRSPGLSKFIRNLERLGVSVADLKEAFATVSAKVVTDAQSNVPVRTGALKASIKASKTKNKALIRAGTPAKTNYASFIEFGTAKISARHMIEKAITDNESYAAQAIEANLSSLIRKYNLN